MTDTLAAPPSRARAAGARPQTGAELVVRTLETRGVTHVFGVPGAKIDGVFDALVDSPIQVVACRHEQNAAFIAGGIGRMTGKAGVAIATSGPGVTNLVTGLSTATSEGDPMVALGGAPPIADALKHVHQITDSVAICRPVTKFAASANSVDTVGEVTANAFRAAEAGRPGAAFVSLPSDVMAEPCPHTVILPPAFAGAGPADGAAIAEAARLIGAARNPVLLLGLMASRPAAAAAIQAFVARHGLPVVGTFQAAGVITEPLFDYFGGRIGQLPNEPADRLLDLADLVLTVGYDPVEYPPADWNRSPRRTIVHLDLEPAALDDRYRPAVELVGDIAQTLQALAPLVRRGAASPEQARLLADIAAERRRRARASARLGGTPIHPLRLVQELQAHLASDVTLCVDVGSFYLWIARRLYSFRARQVLISNGQQTLGVALPWAIAASIVRPAEKVVSISGDGGFLFSAMELETAVRLNCNLVHLVLIDGGYNMVAVQQMLKYGRTSGVDLGPVDVVRYAEAFGAAGFRVDDPDQLIPTLRAALETPGPAVVGVPIDYRDNHTLFEAADTTRIH